ncbi:cation:proton antiporter [bacterium]|nr:cation:proton antiporter [bacterium]
MHETHLFTDLLILFAVGFGAAMLMRLLRLPTLIGFLLAGVLAGPSGLHLLDEHTIKSLSELGVVLLLFTIGLELSLKQLWELRREALIGGGLQLVLTAVVAGGVATLLGVDTRPAIAIGLMVALSSTAVALRLLGEQGRLSSPQGRIALAILLLQDMAVVPLTLIIPMLAGDGGLLDVLRVIGEAVLFVVVLVVVARKVMPWLLDRIAAVRSREGYLLGVGGIVFLITWLTGAAGLSPALGAFLAGLVISETEHKHLALAESAPFRDLLLAVFFVSVGMLIDLQALLANPWAPLLIGLVVYAGKTGLIAAIVRTLGYPWRIGIQSGASIGQIGEFSFVLLLLAAELGVLDTTMVQLMLATAAITLFLTPFALNLASREKQSPAQAADGHAQHADPVVPLVPRVLIIGYGPSGRATARTLSALGFEWHALELNPATVRTEQKAGNPVELGDASRPEVLEGAGVHDVAAVVITINDRRAVRPILMRIRHLAPSVHVIVRARFASELDELMKLGANEVVPEETEGALTIVNKVMTFFGVEEQERRRRLKDLRAENYCMRTSAVPDVQVPQAPET